MTKKDYELIADVIYGRTANAAVASLAVALANRLSIDNPRFNPQRFLRACGIHDYDSSWMPSEVAITAGDSIELVDGQITVEQYDTPRI